MELNSCYEDGNEVEELLKAFNSFTTNMKTTFEYKGMNFQRGLHYQWYQRKFERDPLLKGTTWLVDQINTYNSSSSDNTSNLTIPLKHDGTTYKLEDLTNE